MQDLEFHEFLKKFDLIAEKNDMDDVISNVISQLEKESEDYSDVYQRVIDTLQETVDNEITDQDEEFFEDFNDAGAESSAFYDENNEEYTNDSFNEDIPESESLNENLSTNNETHENIINLDIKKILAKLKIRTNIKNFLKLLKNTMSNVVLIEGRSEPILYFILKNHLENNVESFQKNIRLILSFKHKQIIKEMLKWKKDENKSGFLFEYLQHAEQNTRDNSKALQEAILAILSSQCSDAIKLLVLKLKKKSSYLEDFLARAEQSIENLDLAIKAILSSHSPEAIKLLISTPKEGSNHLEDFLARAGKNIENSDAAIRAILACRCPEAIKLLISTPKEGLSHLESFLIRSEQNIDNLDAAIRFILASHSRDATQLLVSTSKKESSYLEGFLARAGQNIENSDAAIRAILASHYPEAIKLLISTPKEGLTHLEGFLIRSEQNIGSSHAASKNKDAAIQAILTSHSKNAIKLLISKPKKESSYLISFLARAKKNKRLDAAVRTILTSQCSDAIKLLLSTSKEKSSYLEDFLKQAGKNTEDLDAAIKTILTSQCSDAIKFLVSAMKGKLSYLEDFLVRAGQNIANSDAANQEKDAAIRTILAAGCSDAIKLLISKPKKESSYLISFLARAEQNTENSPATKKNLDATIKAILASGCFDAIKLLASATKEKTSPLEDFLARAGQNAENSSAANEEKDAAIRAILAPGCSEAIKLLLSRSKEKTSPLEDFLARAKKNIENLNAAIRNILTSGCSEAIKFLLSPSKEESSYLEDFLTRAGQNTENSDIANKDKDTAIRAILACQCSDAIKLLISATKGKSSYLEDFLTRAGQNAENSDIANKDKDTAIRAILATRSSGPIKFLVSTSKGKSSYLQDFLLRAEQNAENSDAAVRAILVSQCSDAIKLLILQPQEESYLKIFLARAEKNAESSQVVNKDTEAAFCAIINSRCSDAIKLLVETSYFSQYFDRIKEFKADESIQKITSSILSSRNPVATKWLGNHHKEIVENLLNSKNNISQTTKKILINLDILAANKAPIPQHDGITSTFKKAKTHKKKRKYEDYYSDDSENSEETYKPNNKRKLEINPARVNSSIFKKPNNQSNQKSLSTASIVSNRSKRD